MTGHGGGRMVLFEIREHVASVLPARTSFGYEAMEALVEKAVKPFERKNGKSEEMHVVVMPHA